MAGHYFRMVFPGRWIRRSVGVAESPLRVSCRVSYWVFVCVCVCVCVGGGGGGHARHAGRKGRLLIGHAWSNQAGGAAWAGAAASRASA